MRFSEAYSIQKKDGDDWYDPILFEDTLFFVDPFLIYQSEDPLWIDGHDRLTKHFNTAIKLIAESGLNTRSLKWRKARRLLTFPEPSEVCLGYAEGTSRGGGTGPKSAEQMMKNIVTAISKGLNRVESFEELALFGENIGADRISDMVINILKDKFITFTQNVCREYNIPMQSVGVKNTRFDNNTLRWIDSKVELPINNLQNKD
ncbi:hypothetical protein BH23PAT2_BH23PAT2_00920 [soil metagenome]